MSHWTCWWICSHHQAMTVYVLKHYPPQLSLFCHLMDIWMQSYLVKLSPMHQVFMQFLTIEQYRVDKFQSMRSWRRDWLTLDENWTIIHYWVKLIKDELVPWLPIVHKKGYREQLQICNDIYKNDNVIQGSNALCVGSNCGIIVYTSAIIL